MILELIEALSASGSPDRANEDAWTARPRFAVVLDGATGLGGRLMEGPSDAAWLAGQGAERLGRLSDALAGPDLLQAALGEIEAAFVAERIRAPAERYELPMASLMMIEPTAGSVWAAAWYGDCSALVRRPGEAVQVIGDALDSRAEETGRAAALAASLGIHPAGALNRPEFLADRRAERNQRNAEGCPWVFAPDAACASRAQSASFPAPPETVILLASDGFTTLVSDYGLYDPAALVEAALAHGLQPLLDQLRAVEDADPHGALYPRFKKSDDATAVLLRVTA